VDCGKAVVGKAEDRLVRVVVSCGKLCAVDEIPVIPLNTHTNIICSLFRM
jgi:hypothetical protein